MKTNLNLLDKAIRILLALAISILFLNGLISEIFTFFALMGALFFACTGLVGYCPIYKMFGISTRLNLNDRSYKNQKRFI